MGWRWEFVHPPSRPARAEGRGLFLPSVVRVRYHHLPFPGTVWEKPPLVSGEISETRGCKTAAQSIRGPSRALGHRVLERIVGLRREEWHLIPCQKHMCAQRL